jgi:hypothetical protein
MTEKEKLDQARSKILADRGTPDLIVCSPAGWALVCKSWKSRQNIPEKNCYQILGFLEKILNRLKKTLKR